MSFTFCSHLFDKIKLHKKDTIDEFFHNSPGALSGTWALLILCQNSLAIQLESAALQLLLAVAERHMLKGNKM